MAHDAEHELAVDAVTVALNIEKINFPVERAHRLVEQLRKMGYKVTTISNPEDERPAQLLGLVQDEL